MKKILFYFTHKESLGHTTRILSIIRYLKKTTNKKIKIFVFNGGVQQKYLTIPEDISWINLPSPYFSRLNFKKGSTSNFIPFYARSRANYMLSKIKDINPDIFITEFFPFGREDCRFELLPVLTFLKKRGVKIFASIGYPYIVRNNLQLFMRHCDLYDHFLIHTPEELEFRYLLNDIKNPILNRLYLKTLSHIKNRVTYTGYILPFELKELRPKEDIRHSLKIKEKTLVLVSRGGGVRYPKIIASSILAARELSDNYFFLITAGPSSSAKEIDFFISLIKKFDIKNIKFHKYITDMSSYLNASDISINMSGYNTSVQLLYFKKHSIVIPSQEDPETAAGYCSEQISRAKLLHDHLGTHILDYYSLRSKKIAETIRHIDLNKQITSTAKIRDRWFNGGEQTAHKIINAL